MSAFFLHIKVQEITCSTDSRCRHVEFVTHIACRTSCAIILSLRSLECSEGAGFLFSCSSCAEMSRWADIAHNTIVWSGGGTAFQANIPVIETKNKYFQFYFSCYHTCDKFQRGIRKVFLSFPGGF